MMQPRITHYRPPRARVAVAYSTKDRVELTRVTIAPLINDPNIDLYWFDGSSTKPGKQLPLTLSEGAAAICEVHLGVTGGPDSAIVHALTRLRERDYDLVILIENDVLVQEGWYTALRASIDAAEKAGFKAGAASARVLPERVLSFNGDYCLLINSGAGFIGLTPAAVDLVLTNYRTTHGEEINRIFRVATNIDLAKLNEIVAGPLCADFFFDALLYAHGYVVTAPPVAMANNIDASYAEIFGTTQALSFEERLINKRDRLSSPGRISSCEYSFFRFQKSLTCDRSLIACHHLRVVVDSADEVQPVRASGTWRRRWNQGAGPFALFGSGQIRVATYASTIGLMLYTLDKSANVQLYGPDGYRAASLIKPCTTFELALDAEIFCRQHAVMEVTDGEIGFVGVTANADLIAHYANRRASLDHLPL